MIEFVHDWWFLLVTIPLFAGYVLYVSKAKDSSSADIYAPFENSKPGWLLGSVILLGLIMPHIYYAEIVNVLGERQSDVLYFLYLSGVLISSHYLRKSSYFFVVFSNLIIAASWPRTEKMPLYMGSFMALACIIILVLRGVQ